MTKLHLLCAAILSASIAIPPTASAQSASQTKPMVFDVTTVKPHGANTGMFGVFILPDSVNGSTVTLNALVQVAYGLTGPGQIIGGPEWTKADLYEVQGKISPADLELMKTMSPADKALRRSEMLQTLLADRFQLKVHTAPKQVPVYDLVVAKGGVKMRDSATDSDTNLDKDKDGKPLSGIHFLKDTGVAQLYSMQAFALLLSSPSVGLDRPVHDKTGLTGTYNFTINWSVYTTRVRRDVNGAVLGSDPTDDAPSIFTALKELGLKLEPSTGEIETVVIDKVEKPTLD